MTTMPQVGQVVTRVGVSQGTALGIEDGVEAGHFPTAIVTILLLPKEGRGDRRCGLLLELAITHKTR
jgi:hypothetical protein